MPLVNMKELLNHAHRNGYAVGAFDLVNLDFVTGVMEAAEQTASPVILSLAEAVFLGRPLMMIGLTQVLVLGRLRAEEPHRAETGFVTTG